MSCPIPGARLPCLGARHQALEWGRQFEARLSALQSAFALAWESVQLLNEVWMERPPYSRRYHLFRLVAHLAKYWTKVRAVDHDGIVNSISGQPANLT